ncbi:MAG: TRAP transporter small permease [Pseudomonadota bacterium]
MQQTESPPPQKAIDLALPFKILVGAALAMIVILTLSQVFFRYFLSSPILWSEELSRLTVVWMTFIGAAVVCWQGRHLAVDVFVARLPTRARLILRRVNQLLAIGFLVIMTYKSFRIVRLESFQDMSVLPLPGGTVRLAATIGGILMIVALLARLFLARRFQSSAKDDYDSSAM